MRRVKPARSSERGAAAVEFALILPVLILMIFGMVDMGMAINAQAVVGNAAREGARAASFSAANTAAATTVATSAASSLIGTSPAILITCQTVGTTTVIACGTASPGDSVVVKVSYTYKWITPGVLGLPGQSTIVSTSQMRIEST